MSEIGKKLALSAVFALLMALTSVVLLAETPSFHSYYYSYPDSMTKCGERLDRVVKKTDKKWDFARKYVSSIRASVLVGDVRGDMICLAKEPKESWLVIVVTGNDSRSANDLFEELRSGVCDSCPAPSKPKERTKKGKPRARLKRPQGGNGVVSANMSIDVGPASGKHGQFHPGGI